MTANRSRENRLHVGPWFLRAMVVASLGAVLLGQVNAGAAPPARVAAANPETARAMSPRGEATGGMVATVHPLATQAGVAALEAGGNAVDAAVAAAVTLGVVDGHNSGVGGGCLILIRRANGEVLAIDGREMAPGKAHRDLYIRDGKLDIEASQTGPLAAAVPGALAAYDQALAKAGKLNLAAALLPAAKIADDGFAIDRIYASKIASTAEPINKFPETRRILMKPDGSPLREGDVLKQSDLAKTYRGVAEHGVAWFYRGPIAKLVAEWMADQGGIMTEQDFANYEVRFREPLRTTYRGHEVIGFPPPSSGGVHVAQMLNILEGFDLRGLAERNRADFVHVVAESMKLAFADRAFWLGDPDYAPVPRGLADPAYAKSLREKIDMTKTTKVAGHGTPPLANDDLFADGGKRKVTLEKHTTHIAAADSAGNWVAITATVNTTFGSKVIVPGTGVILNNQMDDFTVQPGVANSFGLQGAEANVVMARKRPLSSMSPTVVLKDGRPVLTVGAAGGPTIISQVLLAIINHVDFGLPVDQSLAGHRFHHQWSPDVLRVEENLPTAVQDELKRRGHDVRTTRGIGVSQGIQWDGVKFIGSHDPRVPGKAAGPK